MNKGGVKLKIINCLLFLALIGVLVAPSVVVAQDASACCGVNPYGLTVAASPDPVCIPGEVTLSGTYSTDVQWPQSGPYPTGVFIRVWNPDGVMVVDENLVVADAEVESGTFDFSYAFTADMEGVYGYQVVAWAEGDSGRMDSIAWNGAVSAEQCNLPPDCSAAEPSMGIIWPPNHQMVDITIEGVTDPDGDPVTITIDGIWQDEPLDSFGDGTFEPDASGIGTDIATVRAERSGTTDQKKTTGDGRVYTIAFTASDGQAECSGVVTVGVPHDVKDTPVDGGALYDSTGG